MKNLLVSNHILSLRKNILHIDSFKRITCSMAIAFKSANLRLVQLKNEVHLAVLSHHALSFVQGDYFLSKISVVNEEIQP